MEWCANITPVSASRRWSTQRTAPVSTCSICRAMLPPTLLSGSRNSLAMTEPELYAELTQIFRAVFADDDIVLRPETTADDVEGWDSFTHLNLMIAVEMHFGIKLRTTEVDGMANVADLAKVILSRAEAQT